MPDMFCFQCQQTAGNKGCVRTGVCGKQPETANLQDELVYALIRLAELSEKQGDMLPDRRSGSTPPRPLKIFTRKKQRTHTAAFGRLISLLLPGYPPGRRPKAANAAVNA